MPLKKGWAKGVDKAVGAKVCRECDKPLRWNYAEQMWLCEDCDEDPGDVDNEELWRWDAP